MSTQMLAWLENRTGLLSARAAFMGERIPRSTGWRNTLGSVAGALLLVQILTGILLALYYVAHPDAAYESVAFIEEGVTGGSFVRALHYWGASFIVAALFFHICRVFFSGAYKAPREVTWLLGIVLFIIVMALAFTGQLLPWNQEGYWAAKVGVEIGSSAPVVGDYIGRLIMGGESIGALTLTRFYAAHSVLLPALLGVFVVAHLVSLRRHGPVRTSRDTGDETVPFHPYQLARDLVAISLAFVALAVVAQFIGSPERGPVDQSDTSYLPRPEWYLMSHYQLLRITPGSMKILATFMLPNIAIGLLIALPWLDRSPGTSFRQRRLIVSAGVVVIASVVGMTAWGMMVARGESGGESGQVASTAMYDPIVSGGIVYESADCQSCHRINGNGQEVGPDLSGVGLRLQEPYLRKWLRNPQAFKPDTQMPAVKVSASELDGLVSYLKSLDRNPND